MRDEKMRVRCSSIRSRIRVNVRAALQEDWNSLQTWYKPQDVPDPDDPELVGLLRQETVKDNIQTAKKSSTDPIKKHLIIKALRSEFPQLAAQIPAPPEPEQPPSYAISKANIRYPSSFPNNTLLTTPPGAHGRQFAAKRNSGDASANYSPSPVKMPTTKLAGLQAASVTEKRNFGEKSQSPLKKIKIGDAFHTNDTEDDNNSEAEPEVDNGKDGDFTPQQQARRRDRLAARKRVRTEDFAAKLKHAVTEDQLLRQHVELKQKFRLDEIQIFKKIAHLHGDGAKEFELAEEELEIKHQRKREKARRKYEGAVRAQDVEGGVLVCSLPPESDDQGHKGSNGYEIFTETGQRRLASCNIILEGVS